MADRTVKVNLLANVTQYERSVNSAADSTDDLRRKAERFDGSRYKARLDVETKDADKALKDWARKVDKFRKEQDRADKKAAAEKARAEKQELDASLRRMANAMKEMKRKQQEEFEASKVRVDTSGAMGDLAQMRNEANSLDRDSASPEVNLKIDKFLLNARRVENELRRLESEEATPEADLKADNLHFEIQNIRNEIRKLNEDQSRVVVTADTSKAQEQLRQLSSDLNSLNMKRATPEAEIKIQKFRAQAAQIERDLLRLSQMEASPDVDLATAGAQAKLAAINAELRQFNGRTFKATIDIDSKGAFSRVGTLIAAISSITPLVAATAATGGAAMIGLSGAFTVAAAGAGVVGLAFAGMGNALEAANEYAIDPSAKNLTKLNNTLNQLSASQRNFYNFIQGSLKPALEQLQAAAADGLLPGVQKGAEELLRILPEITNVISRTGQALGQMAASAGESLNDPMWRSWFNFIGNEATTQLVAFAESIGNFIQGFAAMQMAFNPFTQDIINGLRGMSQEFTAWAQSLQGSQEFQEFLNYVRTVGPQVMETFGALASAIGALIVAGAPMGPFFLQIIETFANLIETVAEIPVVGTALMGLATALGVLNLAMRATAGMRAGAATLAAGLGAMGGAARTASPAVTALGTTAQRTGTQVASAGRQAAAARVGLAGVGAAAATSVGGLGGAAGASTRASGAMGALRAAGGALARNLPIVGAAAIAAAAAYDQMNTSATEGAAAMTNQGAAAAATRAELAQNSQTHAEYVASMGPALGAVREWVTAQLGTETTMEQANAEFERQIALMTPLEASTARQQQAQNLLNDAIRQFGPNSQQAADAQRNLAAATADVQVAQELAGLTGEAFNNTLKNLINSGGEMGAAAERTAAGLNLTDLAALGATVSINGVGQAVATMPDGKQIILRADGQNATFQINAVNTQIQALPLNRTINVGAIGGPAQAVLRQIGLEVTTLPDGTVTVTARDEQARAKLAAFVAFGNEQRANPNIDANTQPGRDRLLQLINEANIARGIPTIDANSQAATDVVNQWVAFTNGQQPVPNVNANSGPADNVVDVWDERTNAMRPIPDILADARNAQQEAQNWERNTDAMNPIAEVDANTSQAESAAQGFWNSWAGRTITWFVNLVGGNAKGAIWDKGVAAMASGGILDQQVIANAPGNHLSPYNREYQGKKLRSMPSGGARMVQPNTWRVVGDRMDVPELYAPLDGSGRSLSLIAQGAATFGKTLVDSVAMQSLMGNKFQIPTQASIPRPVNVAREMAAAGASTSKQVVNNVTINNPIAERGSDSVQSRLSRLADLGLFGDD